MGKRFANELYPEAALDEVRPLAVEVPYLYARCVGLWVGDYYGNTPLAWRAHIVRIAHYVDARHLAFVADALAQGLTGDAAWEWAAIRQWDDSPEWLLERAEHYGVNIDAIKPYPLPDVTEELANQ
jgi:hypothetical protein